MNNNRLNHLYVLHVLIPPTPFSCRQKKGECSVLPLFAKQLPFNTKQRLSFRAERGIYTG
jgi:hypothetical protein